MEQKHLSIMMQQDQSVSVVHLSGISHRYPGGEAIAFTDLDIASGQHTLILGNSGSGKTTLLHILSGLLRPTAGSVKIDGQELYSLPPRKLDTYRGQRIGLIFQEAHLVKSLTVKENMQIAQRFAGARVDNHRIDEVLALLELDHKSGSYPSKLSRGQMQRASIARAVVNHPAILVADEPTASLDDLNTDRVLELLLTQASQHGATLIIATHDKRVKTRFEHTYQVGGNV